MELTSETGTLGGAGCSSTGARGQPSSIVGCHILGNLGTEGRAACLSESLGILRVLYVCVSLTFWRHWGSPDIFEGLNGISKTH